MYPHPRGGNISLTPHKEHSIFFSVSYFSVSSKTRNKLTFPDKTERSVSHRSPPTTPLEVILTFEGQTGTKVTSKLGCINYTTRSRNLSGTPVRLPHVTPLSVLGGGQTVLERPTLSGNQTFSC